MPTRDLVDRLPRQLSLRELRAFVTVIEEGSFRRAAASLHVTQPAVTKAIAGLEGLLGVRLFDRGPDGVEPTVQGRSFAPYARSIFEELRSAARELDAVARGRSGRLRLATVSLPTGAFLPLAVRELLDRHPGILVSIVEGRESECCELVRKREADVALVRLVQIRGDNADLDVESLFDAQLYVLAARSHPLASRPVVTWDELLAQDWVMSPPSSPFSRHVRETLAQAGLAMPRSTVDTFSIHMQRSLVMHAGMLGFGSRPRSDLSPLHDVLVPLPFALPRAINAVGAVFLQGHERPPLAVQLLEEIRRLARTNE